MVVRWFSTTAAKNSRWSGQSRRRLLAKALPMAFKAFTSAAARWDQVRRLRLTSGQMSFALRTWDGQKIEGPRSSSSGGGAPADSCGEGDSSSDGVGTSTRGTD
jgi:hypothetical protein